MYIKNCSLMRMAKAYSKQYSVIEQRRFMYIKTVLLCGCPDIFKVIFSDRTAEVHEYQKLLFDAGGPDIFKAIFSHKTAEVHVYQKLPFDADGPGIFKARFSDRTAEVHVYQKLMFDAGVQAYSKQYPVIEQRRFMYIKNCSLMRVSRHI